MKFADFEALSFDCYGTLIDWEAGIAAVLRPWADAHGLPMTDEQLLTAYSTHEAQAEAEQPTDLYPQILARAMRGPVFDLSNLSMGSLLRAFCRLSANSRAFAKRWNGAFAIALWRTRLSISLTSGFSSQAGGGT